MAQDHPDPVPFERPPTENAPHGKQKGAQQHAEGMQGPEARAHVIDQLQSGERDASAPDADEPKASEGASRNGVPDA